MFAQVKEFGFWNGEACGGEAEEVVLVRVPEGGFCVIEDAERGVELRCGV